MTINPPNDQGLSLDELSNAYAELIRAGDDPYEKTEPTTPDEAAEDDLTRQVADEEEGETDTCPVSPQSILEAMLFVGHPQNEPLSSQQVAGLMRGVRAAEIDDLVRELNAVYQQAGCPYTIASVGNGYVLQLREGYAKLRDKFYGKVREAKLSQAAIDVLSIVAYNQPVTRVEVDRLRDEPSSTVLTQLVRRQLLALERPADNPRRPVYRTTDRFLQVFKLSSLDDLPVSEDLSGD